MADVFDLKPFGGPELQRMFNQLPELVQKRILPSAIRASAHRVKAQIGLAWSGAIVQERTGRAADAFADAKVTKIRAPNDTTIIFATRMPDPEVLGIPKTDGTTKPGYYPGAIEYGAPHFAAKAPIRKTVNRIAPSEFAAIGRDIGKRIERRAKRLAKARGIS